MKKYTYLAVVIILVLLLSACGGGQEKSTEVNLYGWSEYVPQAMLDGFTEETGIKVNYDAYSSNEELMAKLQAGGSGYDVIIPSDYTVAILAKQGLLEELDQSKLPNYANIADEFKNRDYDPENKYSIPYQWGTVGLGIDTEKVTTPITKWADLWNPEFKDRVVLLDDEREVIGMVLNVLGYDKNSTNEAELEQAKAKLLELMPNVRLFDSDSPSRALLTGEAWLGQLWNGEGAIAHDENPAINYICPEEGCGIWIDTLAIPKGAPHKDAALAFLNYVMDPKASILITEEFGYSNPNQAALELMKTENPELYDWYMGFAATNPSEADIQNGKAIVDVGDATAIYDRIWTEVKGGE
jgi:spermidine/putrescine transport system substrate-binding protein